MSETVWALKVGAILALIGSGVAVFAVPVHPDRAKAPKFFFSVGALVFAGTAVYWTMLTGRGLLVRTLLQNRER